MFFKIVIDCTLVLALAACSPWPSTDDPPDRTPRSRNDRLDSTLARSGDLVARGPDAFEQTLTASGRRSPVD
jgi:hypothetical protein